MPNVTPPDPATLWQAFWQALWQASPVPGLPWVAVAGLALAALLLVVGATLAWAVPWARRWWTDETPGPDEDERGVSTVELTLQEHLLELRRRLIVSVIALAVTTAVAFVFYPRWFAVAVAPIRGRGNCAAVAAYHAAAAGGTLPGAVE